MYRRSAVLVVKALNLLSYIIFGAIDYILIVCFHSFLFAELGISSLNITMRFTITSLAAFAATTTGAYIIQL